MFIILYRSVPTIAGNVSFYRAARRKHMVTNI